MAGLFLSSLPGMGFNRDGDDLEEVIELNSERSTGDWKIDYFVDGTSLLWWSNVI